MPLHIPSIAVPGRGVLLRDEPSEAACEMLTCLADVLQRLPLSGAPVCLPDEQAQAPPGSRAISPGAAALTLHRAKPPPPDAGAQA